MFLLLGRSGYYVHSSLKTRSEDSANFPHGAPASLCRRQYMLTATYVLFVPVPSSFGVLDYFLCSSGLGRWRWRCESGFFIAGHQVSVSQDVFCAMYKEASRLHQERGLPCPRYSTHKGVVVCIVLSREEIGEVVVSRYFRGRTDYRMDHSDKMLHPSPRWRH